MEQYDAYFESHETLKNRTFPRLWLRYGGDELLLEKKNINIQQYGHKLCLLS
jgi:hypothetical protein